MEKGEYLLKLDVQLSRKIGSYSKIKSGLLSLNSLCFRLFILCFYFFISPYKYCSPFIYPMCTRLHFLRIHFSMSLKTAACVPRNNVRYARGFIIVIRSTKKNTNNPHKKRNAYNYWVVWCFFLPVCQYMQYMHMCVCSLDLSSSIMTVRWNELHPSFQ